MFEKKKNRLLWLWLLVVVVVKFVTRGGDEPYKKCEWVLLQMEELRDNTKLTVSLPTMTPINKNRVSSQISPANI
jgi:hypothetical protein